MNRVAVGVELPVCLALAHLLREGLYHFWGNIRIVPSVEHEDLGCDGRVGQVFRLGGCEQAMKTGDAKNRRIHSREIENAHASEAIADRSESIAIDFGQTRRCGDGGQQSLLKKASILLKRLHLGIRFFIAAAMNVSPVDIDDEGGITETGQPDGSFLFESLRALHRVMDDEYAGSRRQPFVIPGQLPA
jgi:hypothetical protein